nr:restriction endonuclease subunit S [Nicoletella semolina]
MYLPNFYHKYLFYYLLSPVFTEFVNQEMVGVAYPAINDDKLYNLPIAIPPLNEQKRIVAKIEALLPYIEQYAEKEEKLTALHQQFPEQLKKSILQAAIQGKLTEQDPNDEPASRLIERIKAEKLRLIAEKKRKKPKWNQKLSFVIICLMRLSTVKSVVSLMKCRLIFQRIGVV